MREVEEKLFRVREECAHYTEHDTQDGKKYYFNAKLNQSVWDKPKCKKLSKNLSLFQARLFPEHHGVLFGHVTSVFFSIIQVRKYRFGKDHKFW